jgi:hypothetical protein
MPPQQHDRLLDLIDDALNFRAHDGFRCQDLHCRDLYWQDLPMAGFELAANRHVSSAAVAAFPVDTR